jgi:hypothetical protein
VERVAFLVERTGERVACMLNPEHMVVRRLAGVQPRRSIGGAVTGAGLTDDPLVFTGGGTTELHLKLLFDVTLAAAASTSDDVRVLTARLWRLAENAVDEDPYGRPPLVRFVWGKSWNIPGIVAAIAERLEHFTAAGAPRRSWMRVRLIRVGEAMPRQPLSEEPARALSSVPGGPPTTPPASLQIHPVAGGERLDEIAHRYYGASGHPSLWRWLAAYNKLDDPLNIPAGFPLQIPKLSELDALR